MTALRHRLLPWLVFTTMLGVTWLVWEHEHQTSRKELDAQLDFALRDTVSRVEQRVAAHEQMLYGLQGLFATIPLTDRSAIHNYVEKLRLDANFSGIQTIGVVLHVPATQKLAHLTQMHRLGVADYKIHPEGERDSYAPIVQRETPRTRNYPPLGLDIGADPVRRLAAERARDSGMAAITGKVKLAIATDSGSGFIMYLPIFAQDLPTDSVLQRRTHLIGWVYAAFHMNSFMASLYGKPVPGIAVSIYDDANPTDATLMYRTGSTPQPQRTKTHQHAPLQRTEYMVVAGHTWTLKLTTEDEFQAHFGRDAGWIILLTGTGLSLSMALLAWFMVTGRSRALALAAEMTQELRRMAQYDLLTGLPNRGLLSSRVEHELARAKRYGGKFALVFLDLDKFKPINDNFGHAVGDLLLQQVARRLEDSVRASDTIGRIGGDEFVVLVPELTDSNAVLVLAEKIRCALQQPFRVDGHPLDISCSIGIAIYPDDGTDENALTKSADHAMYRAKDAGRNSIQLASLPQS